MLEVQTSSDEDTKYQDVERAIFSRKCYGAGRMAQLQSPMFSLGLAVLVLRLGALDKQERVVLQSDMYQHAVIAVRGFG
ncbi:hypothetical protein BDW72DRAFT_65686 [Aspergillus terricola var. indicus]